MSPVAVLLTVLGLVPFIVCGLGALGPNIASASRMLAALISYAALVLSFIGAVQWGLALAPTELPRRPSAVVLLLGAVPLLLGWLALNVEPDLALAILIAGLIGTVVGERQVISRRSPPPSGYLMLRYGFTVVSVAMLTTVLTLRLLGHTVVL